MGMIHASHARRMLKTKLLGRFLKKRCNTHKSADVVDEKDTRSEANPFDIFGSLPRDIRIDILGYVAAGRPVQVLLMRKVGLS